MTNREWLEIEKPSCPGAWDLPVDIAAFCNRGCSTICSELLMNKLRRDKSDIVKRWLAAEHRARRR